jgi:hypothetical protein
MVQLLTGNLFFASALIVSLLAFVRARPPKLHLALSLCCGLAASVWLWRPVEWYVQIMLVLDYCALAALPIALVAPYFRFDYARQGSLLREMLFAPVSAFLAVLCLLLPPLFQTDTLDRFLYAFDGSLGFQPGFWDAQFLLQHRALLAASEIVYRNLPLGLGVAYYLVRERSREIAAATLRFYLGIAAIGYVAYCFFPASGSGVVFGSAFPFHPPALYDMVIAPAPAPFAPRNCMPSLHAAWALAMYWSTRVLPRLARAAAGLFVGLTLLYALSQHYLVDFVVALPFTLAIYAATRPAPVWRLPSCRDACVFASILFLVWLTALRWWIAGFMGSPAYAWSAVLLSSSACLLMKARMESALLGGEPLPVQSNQSPALLNVLAELESRDSGQG